MEFAKRKMKCYYFPKIGSFNFHNWWMILALFGNLWCWLFLVDVVGVFFVVVDFSLRCCLCYALTLSSLLFLRASIGLEQIRCPENLGKSPWMKLGKMAPRVSTIEQDSNSEVKPSWPCTEFPAVTVMQTPTQRAKHWTKDRVEHVGTHCTTL